MNDDNWLELNNINIIKNNRKILKNINLKLRNKETVVLLGPNGSGKSTLIETIARVNYPRVEEKSSIKILGNENINIFEMRSKIGFVYTDLHARIKRNEKVINIIISGINGYIGMGLNILEDRSINNKAEEIMNSLDLSSLSDRLYFELSDGQKRKVLIGRALINNPNYLIIDEITNALDIKSKYEIIELLNKLSLKKISILYVTHSLDSILKFTDRVILIKNGIIHGDGSPCDILTNDNLSNLYDIDLKVTYINGYWNSIPVK